MKAEGKPEEYGKEKMLDLERWKVSDKALKVVLRSHGTRTCIKRKKRFTMVNFLIFVQKNVSRIRFQEIKIRP